MPRLVLGLIFFFALPVTAAGQEVLPLRIRCKPLQAVTMLAMEGLQPLPR